MFFKDKTEKKEKRDYKKEIDFINIEALYNASKNAQKYYEKELQKLKQIIENFCKSIVSNEYNISQLGGKKNSLIDVYELIEYTKIDFHKQKIKLNNEIKKLKEKINIQEDIIENYKKQLAKSVLQDNGNFKGSVDIVDNTELIESPKVIKIEKNNFGEIKKIDDTEINKTNLNIVNRNKNNEQEQKQNQEQIPTLTIENLDSYISAMTDIMWDILEAIGTQGYSKSNDILFWIEKNKVQYGKSNVFNSLTTLRKMGILNNESVSTGYRRFYIFKLSLKGEKMFESYFKKQPVESEIDKIIRDHCNVTHGYTIKDACELLRNYHGCTNITMDRKIVSIKLPDGKTYIPDIVCNKDNKEIYIEVELGTTPQFDFNNKCNKMMQVTNHLYFITDTDETIKKKLEGQISMWILSIGGKEKIKGNTIYLTTMTQLSKGEMRIFQSF